MNSRRLIAGALVTFLFVTMLVVFGCSTSGQTSEGTKDQGAPEQQAAPPTPEGGEQLYTPEYKPNGNEKAVIDTSKGEIVVQLFGKDAPMHVGNFVELTRKGFYDKTRFHRFEPGFVVQGGDPQTQGLTAEQVIQALQTGNPPLGTGGPGYRIKGEFDPSTNPNKHVEGALGMARSQAPDSAGSQFYFTLAPTPNLDGQYTVFGKVVEGLDVVKELRVGDEIVSVKIEGAE